MNRSTPVAALAALILLLALAAPALGAQRYAAPAGGAASGSCASASPCTLAAAISGAAAGDEVIVEPGDYAVASPIDVTVPLDLHGVAGAERPHLIGGSNLAAATLSFKAGGTVHHLSIDGSASGQSALVLQNGIGEDLYLSGTKGETVKVVAAPSVTVLRDTVARMTGTGGSDSAVKLMDGSNSTGGDLAVVNVTADATSGSATAIRCLTTGGQSSIVNTIVRGAAHDIDASTTGARCTASTSDFRTLLSAGVAAGAGNISADPQFADAPGGNYRPLAGSAVIDAGAADAHLGTGDLDGHARTLGAAPDMGAYELDPGAPPSTGSTTGSTGSTTTGGSTSTTSTSGGGTTSTDGSASSGEGEDDTPIASASPQAGETVAVAPAQGTVLVRRPGTASAVPLEAGVLVPVGSVVDTTRGKVVLQSATDSAGATQRGEFSGGRFIVRQPAGGHGMTELVLTGGSFASCGSAAPRTAAVAAVRRKPVRRLWGKDHGGRFRTRGHDAVATVRGTQWLTEDRCEGTLTRVAQGAVSVRDLHRGTTTLVRAGHQLLVRGPRR